MKLKALLLLLLAALLPLAAPRTAQAADVSFDYFYDALLPSGEWVEVTGYGLCWRPTDVDADWVPYADGYWAFTDAGWTWVGYEEFAGIVYHYGRWINVVDVGWVWQPDYEWGPAWVSWRNSDDYIGWAPLPPRAYWQPEIGISTWVDTVCDIGPGFYNFCRVRDFGAPVLRLVIVNHTRNVTIIRNTVNITNITYNTYGDVPVIYNGGPSYTVISSRCERPIPALKLVRTTHFDRTDFHGGPGRWSPNARTVGNQLLVNAPIVAPPLQPAFLKEKVKRVFAADKVATGWAGVKDGKVRDDLRQHFQRETKGLTPYTAPARAVVAADLKVVPAQADAHAVSPAFTGQGPRGKGDGRPPITAENPVAPLPPASAVTDAAKPMKDGGATVSPPEPRGVAGTGRENGRGKNGEVNTPPAVTGGPLKPFNQDAVTNPAVTAPAQEKVADPRAGGKNDRPKMDREAVQNPVVVAPPDAEKSAVQSRENRGPKPMKDGPAGGFHPPGTDPAAAQAQAAAEAAKAAREQADIQQQKMDAEKLRATQAEADKLKSEQERMARQREADANAAALREKQATARELANTQQQKMETEKLRATQAEMEKAKGEQERLTHQREAEASAAAMRQKQAAEAAAANAGKEKMQIEQQQRAAQAEREKLQTDQERMTRQREADAAAVAKQKQLDTQREADAQRQAEAAKQADVKRQQMEAQAVDRQRQQQEQIAAQRQQLQMEQQRAQDAAKQQAAERAREQQMEQQRAAQEVAKQQALEQRRQQQMEQQRTAQDAARQQALEQQRQQQMEQQRAAQESVKQQALEQQRQQQMEQQRATQDAARQQALEQQRQQQMEQQRAAQENAKQQAEQQHRALEAQREQAGRQQMEAQRAAQQQAAQAAQAAQESRRAEKEKDKDKSR